MTIHTKKWWPANWVERVREKKERSTFSIIGWRERRGERGREKPVWSMSALSSLSSFFLLSLSFLCLTKGWFRPNDVIRKIWMHTLTRWEERWGRERDEKMRKREREREMKMKMEKERIDDSTLLPFGDYLWMNDEEVPVDEDWKGRDEDGEKEGAKFTSWILSPPTPQVLSPSFTSSSPIFTLVVVLLLLEKLFWSRENQR